MKTPFEIEWRDRGREPECPSNAAYPEGIDVDASLGAEPSCVAVLPYPAKRCGTYLVRCNICGFAAGCTTAGRPDDPRSIRLPCQTRASA